MRARTKIAGLTLLGLAVCWLGASSLSAAEPVTTGAGCVKEALARADAGKPEEGLPWLVEALRLDAGKPERVALHRQRLACFLQGAADRARRPTEPGDPQPRWNGHGFAAPVHYPTTNEIKHAAVSPDGRWVACIQKDEHSFQGVGGLLWDLQQPEAPPKVIETKMFGNDSTNTCNPGIVIFSPDSRRVALAFHSFLSFTKGYVQVWDCATARTVGPPLHLPYSSRALAFSPDGKHIAAGWGEICGLRDPGVNNYGARVWEVSSGKPLVPPIELSSAATLVRFSPDGKQVLVGTLGKRFTPASVTVWDIFANKPAGPVLQLASRTTDAAFLPDGLRVAVAADEVNLWDVRTGKRLDLRLSSDQAVERLWLGADGGQLFARLESGDDRLLAWDLKTGKPIANEPGSRIDFQFALAADAKRVFVSRKDSMTGDLRDTNTGERLSPALPEQANTHFSNDGRRLLTWGESELVVHTIPGLAWPEADTADLAAFVAGQTVRDGRLVALEPKARRDAGERLAKKYPKAFAAVEPPPAKPRDAYRRVELSARIGDAVLAAGEEKGRADARKVLEKIVKEHPAETEAWVALAYVYDLGNQWADAVWAYNGALTQQPHHRDALLGRGRIYADRLGRADLASTDLQTALDLQPLDWNAQFELAWMKLIDRQWKTALDLFARADAAAKRVGDDEVSGRHKTNYPYIFRNRGTCLAELGRWKEAAEEYRQAVKLDDGNGVFRSELVRVYAELKEFDAARALCEKLVATLTDETEAQQVDAIAWLCCVRPGLLKDYAPAIRAVERIIVAEPKASLYHETLAWLHLHAGQPALAVKHFDAFAKLKPEGGLYYWTGVAIALKRSGKADAAKEFHDKALAELKRLEDAGAKEPVSWATRLDYRHYRDELKKTFPAKTDKR